MGITYAGDSGLRGPETPVLARDSSHLPRVLRTGTRGSPHLARLIEGPETPVRGTGDSGAAGYSAPGRRLVEDAGQAGDSGHQGPDTPASRRLRAPSGVPPEGYPVPHHTLARGQEKQGAGDSGLEGRKLRPGISCSKQNLPFSSLFGA